MCEALWTGAEKVDRCSKVNILPRGGRAAGKGATRQLPPITLGAIHLVAARVTGSTASRKSAPSNRAAWIAAMEYTYRQITLRITNIQPS